VTDWIAFGYVARAHGIRGELRVAPLNAGDDLPESVRRVRLTTKKGEHKEYEIESARPANDAWLVTFARLADRDAAQALVGSTVEIALDDLPPLEPGEMYLFELNGAAVDDEAGATLGTVRAFGDNNGQDVLIMDAPGGERLLPLVEDTVVRFEREAKRLIVRVVPGLWDES
jgi:16S rRNA processing protein RimM